MFDGIVKVYEENKGKDGFQCMIKKEIVKNWDVTVECLNFGVVESSFLYFFLCSFVLLVLYTMGKITFWVLRALFAWVGWFVDYFTFKM